MKVEKLLLKAFNWYYEERIWNTNISNEEALEFFKETDTYQDFYYKASDDATSQDQALNIAGVSSSLRYSEREIDLAYLTGVFNVSGIDGLQKEIERLKGLGKNPHDIIIAAQEQ